MMFWSVEKLERRREELRRHVARRVIPVAPVMWSRTDGSEWVTVQPHQRIAERPDQLLWFRGRVEVPAELAGKPLALRFGEAVARGGHDHQPESMLFLNGSPYHGVDRNHRTIFLPVELCQGAFEWSLQAWSGRYRWEDLYWQNPELIWFDAETDALAYDLDAIVRTVKELDKHAPARAPLLELGEAALGALDWTHPGSDAFYASVRAARAITTAGLAELEGTDALKPTVLHTGHTHLDVAWLWTLENIKLKTARSWLSALRLMEQYPDFRWIQSQPQLYKFIKETQPEIWEQVKARVAEGRWEADGGMWVEADCNLTGGESLIRQFLFGTRFFKDEFGVRNVVLWLPDVFGYAWALPQIIKGCGLKYFVTTKISWSQFNRFPYDTFKWRGIDGTELLTHYITAPTANARPGSWFYTYNAEIFPDTVQGNWNLYQQKELNTETLSSFGWGDGGGGPTREMMEFAHRLADMPGIPHVEIGRVDSYLERLEQRVWANPNLPTWDGELYLEYHRGTYTSQAQQKRNNRKSELLLHNAELFGATAGALLGAGYPKAALDEAWETVLRNQFHDIIPGSSIHDVYVDSRAEYQRVFELGGAAVAEATGALAAALDLPEPALVVFNGTGMARTDLVQADLPAGLAPAGLTVQDGGLILAEDVPANGYRAYPLRPAVASGTAAALTVTEQLLESPLLRVELNAAGQIVRIYDKQNQREVLAPGQAANVLQAFEDKPMNFDAWDIDIFYQQKCREVTDLISATVEEAGPLRGALKLVWRFEDSTITQRVLIYAHTPRLDFETHVDWQQSQILLKAAFPVEIRATQATYEIQFGNVQRPTHWNTSWDWARFETVAHKWADLSEGGYGVSLLNDCKYGHDIKDSVLRLTLIKSPISPDPVADRGEHRFTYSIFPHAEDWYRGGTVAEAYALNNPLAARVEGAHAGALPAAFSLVACPTPHVLIETVKPAESGRGLVVRVYEFANRRGAAELVFGRPVRAAFATNLLEDEPKAIPADGCRVAFHIKPYEIKTFVVEMD